MELPFCQLLLSPKYLYLLLLLTNLEMLNLFFVQASNPESPSFLVVVDTFVLPSVAVPWGTDVVRCSKLVSRN